MYIFTINEYKDGHSSYLTVYNNISGHPFLDMKDK